MKWQSHSVNWKSRFFLPSPHTVHVLWPLRDSSKPLQVPASERVCDYTSSGKHHARRVGENPLKEKSPLKDPSVNVELSSSNLKIWLKRHKLIWATAHLPWPAHTAQQVCSWWESRCQLSASKQSSAQSSPAPLSLRLGRSLVWTRAAFSTSSLNIPLAGFSLQLTLEV